MPPTITMVTECCHYETNVRSVSENDSKTRTETYQEKVGTVTIEEPFVFYFWRNQSPSKLFDLHKKKVTKIKMQLEIEFGKSETAVKFEDCYARFKEVNRHRGELIDFSVSRQDPGFEERLTTYGDSKPDWMNYK